MKRFAIASVAVVVLFSSVVFAATPPTVSEEKIAMKNVAKILVQASLEAAGDTNTDLALGFAVAAGDVAREAGSPDLEQEVSKLSRAYRLVGLLNVAAELGQGGFPLAATKLSSIACEMADGVEESNLQKMISEALSFCGGRTKEVNDTDEMRVETMSTAIALISKSSELARSGVLYDAVGYALAASDIARHYGETVIVQKIDDAVLAYRVVILDGVAELFTKEGGQLGAKGIMALTCRMVANVAKEHRPLVEKARACGVST